MTQEKNHILPGCEGIIPQLKRAAGVFDAEFYDFSLYHLFDELKTNGYDAHRAKFRLRGYALEICNPMNIYIRYVGGYLWIGTYGIMATTYNEAYSAITELVSSVLDGGNYNDYEEIMVERRKEKMLKAINQITLEASKAKTRTKKQSRI